MKKYYKTAAYTFSSEEGLNQQIIESLTDWLNVWNENGYEVDKISEITKDGKCSGFFFVFKLKNTDDIKSFL